MKRDIGDVITLLLMVFIVAVLFFWTYAVTRGVF